MRVPEIRATVAGVLGEETGLDRAQLLGEVDALWAEPVHEARMAAVEVLRRTARGLGPADLPRVERMLREARTWALVDPLAVEVAGAIVERHPAAARALDRWAADEDVWLRRSALLALLKPLRRGGGDFERFARYADAMLEEREFFVRKAIGWVLRESSRRRPGLVSEWLVPRAHRASGVTIREAVKYLPAADRRKIERSHRQP